QRAQLYARAGAEERALADLRLAHSVRADWTEGTLELAWLLANARSDAIAAPDEALALARSVEQSRGPNDPGVLDVRAALLAGAGRFEEAAAAARTAIASARAAGDAAYAARIERRVATYAANRFERGAVR